MKLIALTRGRVPLMVKMIVGLAIPLVSFLMPTPASACCSVSTGPVKSIGYLTNGIFFFTLDAQTNSSGACNTQSRFALNTNISSQKTLMVLVLASQTSGVSLQVVGMQTCNNWPDSEDVGSVKSM
jgi:hypothetical protein